MTKRTAIVLGATAGAAAILAAKLASSKPKASITGEVALITGGSRGLGLALAREFAGNGCRVAICARDRDELDRAVRDLKSRGADVFAYSCDVSKQAEVNRMFAEVTRHFGGVDILVNNAGIIQVGPVESLDADDFERAMDVMFWGTVYPTLAALPAFLERQSGRIVNISSIGGKVSVPHLLPYTSAKYAVSGFSQGLAAELRPQGVGVTTIYPGLLRTGSFIQALFKGKQTEEAEWFTLGATAPGVSMNADRAARQIVDAVRIGEPERTLSIPAKIAAAVNAAFPGGTNEILSAITAVVLPKPSADKRVKKGALLWDRMHPAVRALSALGIRAMHDYNQRA